MSELYVKRHAVSFLDRNVNVIIRYVRFGPGPLALGCQVRHAANLYYVRPDTNRPTLQR
jgi:hypothetical protein